MNKLYGIEYYVKGICVDGVMAWNERDVEEKLKNFPNSRVVEDNEVHKIWRIDL